MISGTEMGHETNDEMMAMGININEQDAQKRLKGFLTRAGWQDLPAVKKPPCLRYLSYGFSLTKRSSSRSIYGKSTLPKTF